MLLLLKLSPYFIREEKQMKKFLEKEDRKWFNDKVIVMSFGGDKEEETKLKKNIEDKFIKEQKKRKVKNDKI